MDPARRFGVLSACESHALPLARPVVVERALDVVVHGFRQCFPLPRHEGGRVRPRLQLCCGGLLERPDQLAGPALNFLLAPRQNVWVKVCGTRSVGSAAPDGGREVDSVPTLRASDVTVAHEAPRVCGGTSSPDRACGPHRLIVGFTWEAGSAGSAGSAAERTLARAYVTLRQHRD